MTPDGLPALPLDRAAIREPLSALHVEGQTHAAPLTAVRKGAGTGRLFLQN